MRGDNVFNLEVKYDHCNVSSTVNTELGSPGISVIPSKTALLRL